MNKIREYAELLIKKGVNVQPDQLVMIIADVEVAEFARVATEEAYRAGAGDVIVRWVDDNIMRLKIDHASNAAIAEAYPWLKQMLDGIIDRGGCVLNISNYKPGVMKGVDLDRFMTFQIAQNKAAAYYREHMMSNKNAWCVAAFPTVEWAEVAFPDLKGEVAKEALWTAILSASRADQDKPMAAWQAHTELLHARISDLNAARYDHLRYQNSLGTNFTVKLPDDHIWLGGSEEQTTQQYTFSANIPTEEVFTTALANGVDGRVVSSKPLVYRGNMIDEFWFDFVDGRIESFDAKVGRDVLEKLLSVDDGARRIGEVALVPHDSPISNSNLLFYNTLFDENASSHLAIGRAYAINIKGGEEMSSEQLRAAGINQSMIHEDFMIGTADMRVVGVKADGTEEVIMENGNFVK